MKVKETMKKGHIVVSIISLLVAVIMVATLFIQFRTIEKVNESDIEGLRETELREMISTWKEKYEDVYTQLSETNDKINSYKQQIDENDQSLEVLDSELRERQMLLGKTRVKGEGVTVTLSDNENYAIKSSDLLELINELRFGGAEAISINGIRVVATTDIVDIGDKFIIMKPSQRISSPFVVTAIGNKTYLSSTLSLKNSGFIDTYTNSGRTVTLDINDYLEIPAYNWDISSDYMKEVTE